MQETAFVSIINTPANESDLNQIDEIKGNNAKGTGINANKGYPPNRKLQLCQFAEIEQW